MRILVVNRGSSSLKHATFEVGPSGARREGGGVLERVGAGADLGARLCDAVGALDAFDAVAHRVVHGGAELVAPTRATEAVMARLRALVDLDPTHLPLEIALVDAVAARAPSVAQTLSFDTAFHAAMPRVATLLPIPRELEARGVRRYGFHGISYRYLLEELARVAGDDAARGRVVLAHLGSGASLAAVRDGRPVDTTMGFTPNSGIPMGTRSGDLEPGVVAYLARSGLSTDAIEAMLNERSGLAGLSGGAADVRDLLAREDADAAARDALDVFCLAVRKAIGALAASLEGLDTLVFSAGIGERSPAVRARVAAGLGHLGVGLDAAENARSSAVISPRAAPVTVRVIATDEEIVLARDAAHVLRNSP
jgi:acetate kinase